MCGKNVTHEGGFARIDHKGTMVNLCCPLCLETFQKDPAPHMARLAKVLEYQALRDLPQPEDPNPNATKRVRSVS